MSGLGALLRKELLHEWRSMRLYAALVLFGGVGAGSPWLAWLVPYLLERMPEDELGGVEILLTAQPTAADALGQFVENYGLLSLLVVLAHMGAIAGERSRGTAAMVLARPVSRRAFLASKLMVPAAVYGACTVVGAIGCLVVTRALFGPVHVGAFAALTGLLYLDLLVVLAVTVLGSSAVRGVGAAAGIGIGAMVLKAGLTALPAVGRYTPGAAGVMAAELVVGQELVGAPLGLAVVVGTIALCVGVADRLVARMSP